MIALTTTVDIAGREESLKTALGEAITLLPGKSESHLMISLSGKTPMFFQGEAREAAFLEISCFGKGQPAAYDKMTGRVCEIMHDLLGVSPANTYVKYAETTNWGWNGGNF
jgi:phenylpyruvate tautomerase PptA (4-oxalocrotonate tautomerase family)